jgi:malate dehydrogenase
MKVTVVGAGMVGSTTALRLLEDRTADALAIIDVVDGLARAVALDLGQSAPLRGHTADIEGGSDYGLTEGSDLVIITAGLPRSPGQSRADLLQTNAEIVEGVVSEIRRTSPQAILIVVTNPLDEMTTLAWHVSGFPAERVVGMAGVLDTSRFAYFIARQLQVDPGGVDALVLGSHGETMVPLPRVSKVNGRTLTQALPADALAGLVERTRDAGAEIVGLLPRGSAWMAPSAAIADMAKAIAGDEHRVVSACAYLRGQYGLSDVYLGVPVRLGRKGVEEIVELPLQPGELTGLRDAAEMVRARVADLGLSSPLPAAAAPPAPAAATSGIDALRRMSRVRKTVKQILWESGTVPDAAEVDRVTDAVLERMGEPPAASGP